MSHVYWIFPFSTLPVDVYWYENSAFRSLNRRTWKLSSPSWAILDCDHLFSGRHKKHLGSILFAKISRMSLLKNDDSSIVCFQFRKRQSGNITSFPKFVSGFTLPYRGHNKCDRLHMGKMVTRFTKYCLVNRTANGAGEKRRQAICAICVVFYWSSGLKEDKSMMQSMIWPRFFEAIPCGRLSSYTEPEW